MTTAFERELLQILREIRNELHEHNKLQRESINLYAKTEDRLAQFDESHDELKIRHKDIINELRELNRSVEED